MVNTNLELFSPTSKPTNYKSEEYVTLEKIWLTKITSSEIRIVLKVYEKELFLLFKPFEIEFISVLKNSVIIKLGDSKFILQNYNDQNFDLESIVLKCNLKKLMPFLFISNPINSANGKAN